MNPNPRTVAKYAYKILTEAVELAQDYRIAEDQLTGTLVKELDLALQLGSTYQAGKDYFYFSPSGLKGAAFAWNKAGNAAVFRNSTSGGIYYLVIVTMGVAPQFGEDAVLLAQGKSGASNDVFFEWIAKSLQEAASNQRRMLGGPGLGSHATPSI